MCCWWWSCHPCRWWWGRVHPRRCQWNHSQWPRSRVPRSNHWRLWRWSRVRAIRWQILRLWKLCQIRSIVRLLLLERRLRPRPAMRQGSAWGRIQTQHLMRSKIRVPEKRANCKQVHFHRLRFVRRGSCESRRCFRFNEHGRVGRLHVSNSANSIQIATLHKREFWD